MCLWTWAVPCSPCGSSFGLRCALDKAPGRLGRWVAPLGWRRPSRPLGEILILSFFTELELLEYGVLRLIRPCWVAVVQLLGTLRLVCGLLECPVDHGALARRTGAFSLKSNGRDTIQARPSSHLQAGGDSGATCSHRPTTCCLIAEPTGAGWMRIRGHHSSAPT